MEPHRTHLYQSQGQAALLITSTHAYADAARWFRHFALSFHKMVDDKSHVRDRTIRAINVILSETDQFKPSLISGNFALIVVGTALISIAAQFGVAWHSPQLIILYVLLLCARLIA